MTMWTVTKSHENFEIPAKLIKITGINNSKAYCKIQYKGEIYDQFELKSELKKEDVKSSILF